jgi:hypothetical protein
MDIPESTNASDFALTETWFGSGAVAFRATVVSERFVALLQTRQWRGVSLKPVAEAGDSIRAI